MASIFTKIINREIPAEIIFENNNIIVIKDINPEAKTHLLIIPKEEIPSINDLTIKDNNLLIELFEVAKNIAKELNIEEWYKLHFNVWPKEQDVMHIHLHLLSNI
jgi:histidine triad (HIT) family protein